MSNHKRTHPYPERVSIPSICPHEKAIVYHECCTEVCPYPDRICEVKKEDTAFMDAVKNVAQKVISEL